MAYKKLLYVLLGLFFLYNCSETPTSAEDPEADPNEEEELLMAFGEDDVSGKVKVMSRNIYIGTNVADLFGASSILEIPTTVRSAFNLLESTNFAERAEALVDEIEKTRPHLIGLQEVAHVFIQTPGDFLSGNLQKANFEIYDYLQILMDALSARGINYNVAAVLSNADIELPMLPTVYSNINSTMDDIRLIDRDVILVRSDVSFTNVATVRYSDSLVIEPLIGISVPRGYTAITAEIDGNNYRFANTHLEVADFSQSLKSGQLEQLLAEIENELIPVILAGDFNFNPDDNLFQTLKQNGYADAWENNTLDYNPNGYTYGHNDDLKNKKVRFSGRIDYIFTKSQNPFSFEESFVVGDELRDRTVSRLWPSDHGGVITKINFNQ